MSVADPSHTSTQNHHLPGCARCSLKIIYDTHRTSDTANRAQRTSIFHKPTMFHTQSSPVVSYQEGHRGSSKTCGGSRFTQATLTCQDSNCDGGCCLGSRGCCCCGSGEVAGVTTGAQFLEDCCCCCCCCCCWKCEGCRRSVPPGFTGDEDGRTALCVDDRATDGWGDGPGEGLLWYEPRSPVPSPRVLSGGK